MDIGEGLDPANPGFIDDPATGQNRIESPVVHSRIRARQLQGSRRIDRGGRTCVAGGRIELERPGVDGGYASVGSAGTRQRQNAAAVSIFCQRTSTGNRARQCLRC